MASIGKISSSFIQGTNENTFALANINFDFSLVSLAAPAEYAGLGSALAHSRRENAGHGALHRAARKLGALFEGVVPQVPHLMSAYGERASEIMKNPGLNPSGNADIHGPFAAFVGADATSIWAAATSGGPAIAIHLLGCLLARSFSDPAKSVSALVELVHERQRHIRNEGNAFTSTASHIASLMAAEQPIQRDELQQWDVSTRAWLQTADSAMQREYTQLRLILQNISVPITSGSSLYDGVLRAWTNAMNGLERLLNGEPQSVTDGAILLAISAWHLYPNLLVLGREFTKVDFGHHGIQSSGLLTVGITYANSSAGSKDGIYWSMALSHYRHYGRPLRTVGEIDDRLTIEQLHLVALGSLLRDWNVPRNDVEPTARWLNALEGCLSRTKASLGCPPWLTSLAKAARVFLGTEGSRKKEAIALVDFGQRRGTNLLRPRGQSCLPWFGLRFRHIVRALATETPRECAVEYLRSVASAGNLRYDEALITFIADTPSEKGLVMHQYFTATTRNEDRLCESFKFANPGHVSELVDKHRIDESLRNAREIPDADHVPELEYDSATAPDEDEKGKSKLSDDNMCHNGELHVDLDLSSHRSWSGLFRHDGSTVKMPSYDVSDPEMSDSDTDSEVIEANPQSLIAPLRYEEDSYRLLGGISTDCRAVLPNRQEWFPSSPITFEKFIGDPKGTIRLWLAQGRSVDKCEIITDKILSLQSGASAEVLDMDTAIGLLDEGGGLEPLLVWQYLEGAEPYEPDSAMKEVFELMRTERERFALTLKSLRGLDVATNIYNRLDGAKVSSSIVEKGLYDVMWVPKGRHAPLTRSMVFSCIAFMETGKISLDTERLEHVIALSSGNSLFVSTRLLTDPYDEIAESSVTRIIGNVGLPGVNLLIPPAASPLSRSLSTSFRAVTYASFNGRREDNFKGTTLHLSFTSHKFPLDYGVSGIVDHQVFFVESVISVHDSGEWVADLDVLGAFNIRSEFRVPMSRTHRKRQCAHSEGIVDSVLDSMTSIDSWEEVLDTNPSVNIIRAHRNWPARLATSVMLSKTRVMVEDDEYDEGEGSTEIGMEQGVENERHFILENGDDVCWVCLYRSLSKAGKISATEPFCIIA